MSRPDDADKTADPDGVPPSVASDDGEPAGVEEGDGRRRRRAYLVGSGIGILVAIVIAVAFVRVPYYRFSPGTLYRTEGLISVDGAPTYTDDEGQIDFTTVSSKKVSVLEAILARFDDAVELIDADKIDGNNPPEETRRINLEMMSDSKSSAQVVALRKLGYPIVVEGSGALVKSVSKDSPAEKVLKENDAIVAIDGQPVHLRDDAITAIGKHKAGDEVSITVESAPGEPQREVTATLASRCDFPIPTGSGDPPPSTTSSTTSSTSTVPSSSTPSTAPVPASSPGTVPGTSAAPGSTTPAGGEGDRTCSAEDAAKPVLGVALGTRDTHFKLPFRLVIDTKDVGGPSAGLALTLGIIDVLTPGSLTGGRHVATTGTINLDGTVGPIGGIRQKTYLAMRQGVDLFIVPADEYDEAAGYAKGSSLKVVAVTTLDEALQALADNGGATDVVEQAAAANSPGTTTS
jgi:PDZ domain-containing protein